MFLKPFRHQRQYTSNSYIQAVDVAPSAVLRHTDIASLKHSVSTQSDTATTTMWYHSTKRKCVYTSALCAVVYQGIVKWT
jgi:hypothetical protein